MSNPASAFAVPVVRLILPDERKRVLLLERSEQSQVGGWCLPGGKIDYGGTVEHVLRKELKEETDLELCSVRFLFFQDSLPSEPGATHYLNLYFECTWSGVVKLNHESSHFSWVDEETVGQYTIAFGNDKALKAYWARDAKNLFPPFYAQDMTFLR
jgi:8-oxo-dGTP diphosphatase